MSREKPLEYLRTQPVNRHQLVTLADMEDFKKDLLVAIQRMLSQNSGHSPKKWLKTYEVKKILNISSGTLQTLRSNGTIPFSKIGGIIYYNASDVDAVLEKQKRDFSKIWKTR